MAYQDHESQFKQWGLDFGPPARINTRNGDKIVRHAAPGEQFWRAWKQDKETVRSTGISVSKYNGQFRITHWDDVPKIVLETEEKSKMMSLAADTDSEYPAPQGLAYLGYQKAGIDYCQQRTNALIADEMGLGKTIQAIGLINASDEIRKILVLCPASLKLNWMIELRKWLTRNLFPAVIYSDSSSTILRSNDILIANYDILVKHEWSSLNFDLVIADEAHYLKNLSAVRTKAFKEIKTARRLFLTGTPIVNRPKEIIDLVSLLDPEVFPNTFKAKVRYCNGSRSRWGWDFNGSAHLEELQDLLRSRIMVRRLKSEVLSQLPAKTRQIIALDDTTGRVKAEQEVLNKARQVMVAAKNIVEENERVTALKKAKELAFGEIMRARHETALAKLPDTISILEDAIKAGKVICFAHHKDVIAGLVNHFGVSAVSLTGEHTAAERQSAVERFQNDETVLLFIGSIRASGTGITLTASSHVIFAELDWTPSAMSQAEDRAHRIGQHDAVLVQHIVLDGSLDSKIAKMLIDKQAIIDKALDGKNSNEDCNDSTIAGELLKNDN